jgi:hypothetical protein
MDGTELKTNKQKPVFTKQASGWTWGARIATPSLEQSYSAEI